MEPSVWKYFVELRNEISSTITGISNAESFLWWDNTTPNSTTRLRLQSILRGAIRDGAVFGVYVVTRHIDCERRSHRKASDAHGYVWSDPYGFDVQWEDNRFVWDGDQLFQGTRYETCPCSNNDQPVRHHVIDDVIYASDGNINQCRLIGRVLSDVQSAIDAAGDHQPRSGIREYLLRAILRLNDSIMPETVDEHIKARIDTSNL